MALRLGRTDLRLTRAPVYADRFDFLLHHHVPGEIVDLGNVGGVLGQGPSNSFHARFRAAVEPKSTLMGVDLFEPPPERQAEYPNQVKHDLRTGLPFEDNRFDTVYAGEVIEHMPNPQVLISDVKRILKPGGVFICDVPNPYALTRLLRFLRSRHEHVGDPTHVALLTPGSLVNQCELAGLVVKELATDWKQRRFGWVPARWRAGLGSDLMLAAGKVDPAT